MFGWIFDGLFIIKTIINDSNNYYYNIYVTSHQDFLHNNGELIKILTAKYTGYVILSTVVMIISWK